MFQYYSPTSYDNAGHIPHLSLSPGWLVGVLEWSLVSRAKYTHDLLEDDSTSSLDDNNNNSSTCMIMRTSINVDINSHLDPQIPSSQQQSSLIIPSYPIQLDLSVEGYVMLAGWIFVIIIITTIPYSTCRVHYSILQRKREAIQAECNVRDNIK